MNHPFDQLGGAATFRNQVKQVSGKEITSEQSKNFLEIFGEDLAAEQVKTTRRFIEKHYGNKNSNQ